MNFKKAIKFTEIKKFLEKKGFKHKSEFGAELFYNPFGEYISISESKSELGMIYLDCNLLYDCGLPNFKREWKDGIHLYDYIIHICYPLLRNIKGSSSLDTNPEVVIKYVKQYLEKRKVCYTYTDKAVLSYINCSPQRSLYEQNIKYNLFSFIINNVKYGIVLKQFNFICLARFKDNTNTVFFEYPWYSFCPIYKEGKDYVETTISNFLEFIEKDKKEE